MLLPAKTNKYHQNLCYYLQSWVSVYTSKICGRKTVIRPEKTFTKASSLGSSKSYFHFYWKLLLSTLISPKIQVCIEVKLYDRKKFRLQINCFPQWLQFGWHGWVQKWSSKHDKFNNTIGERGKKKCITYTFIGF